MIRIAVFLSLVFLYSLVSKRLARTVLTAPTVFTAAGMLTFLDAGLGQVIAPSRHVGSRERGSTSHWTRR